MFPCVEIAEIKFLAISSKLKGILVEHISEICRVNSQLQIPSLCSIRGLTTVQTPIKGVAQPYLFLWELFRELQLLDRPEVGELPFFKF